MRMLYLGLFTGVRVITPSISYGIGSEIHSSMNDTGNCHTGAARTVVIGPEKS